MSTYHCACAVRRVAVVGAAVITAALTATGTASAHAEVEADKPQALAENVTLAFVSEAESDSAGFTRLQVVLPEGIAPADVTLAEGPKGWKLKPGADGYTIGGPALGTGVDAEHKIKVRRLPDAAELVFKTVETYSDGEVSRWIELPSGDKEPAQPAPVLKLKAAAPGTKPTDSSPSPTSGSSSGSSPSSGPSSGPASPEASGPAPSEVSPAGDTTAAGDDGPSPGLVAGGVLVALLGVGGGAWWLVKRRTGGAGA
ncbi:DUF1775 domain-containing protein [Streptomyces sp. NPDC050546]|uniref:DUF1775 domain-containing protein n=1 Tax=Streptomyces sp. NPDC050546 TaxID=3365628 RepID=UPI003792963E